MVSDSAVLTNPSVERVRRALELAGLQARIVELPGATRTATEKLSQLVGEPIAKADADFVRRQTGFAIGGVAPVGHGLSKVFVEKALAAQGELWAAAGHPHTVFRLTYSELLRITGGNEAKLAV